MATYEEIQRLVLEVENLTKLKDLNQTLEQEQKLMHGLVDSFKQGSIGQQQYTQSMAVHGERVIQLNAQVKELQNQTKGAMNAMGAMQIGYALQDFFAAQGGPAQKFNAIANNLQMLAASMGIGGAWFLAITGVISALQAVASNWDAIEAHFKGLPDPKETKAKADAAKAKADEYKRLLGQPTPEEKRQQGQGAGALDQYDQEKLAGAIKAALVAEGKAVGPSGDQQIDWMKQNRNRFGGDTEAFRQAWEQEANRIRGAQYDAEVQRLMQGARGSGPESMGIKKRIVDMAGKNEGAFPPGFLAWSKEALLGIRPPGGFQGPPDEALLLRGELEGKEAAATQAARDAATARDAAERRRELMAGETPEQRRKRMNAAAPSQWAAPIGQLSDTAGDQALELSQLRSEAALNQADAQVDAMLGMNGPALQRQMALEARIQAIVRKLSGVDAGGGATGAYSYLPTGTW